MITLTPVDEDNLKMLQEALSQHHSFGVNTDPNYPGDQKLHQSMLRLEKAGLVQRKFETDLGIWWQAIKAGEK